MDSTALVRLSDSNQWFAIFVDVRTIVRKQFGTLGLGMAAGVVSASAASLIQNAFRVDGSFIFFPLCASLSSRCFSNCPRTRCWSSKKVSLVNPDGLPWTMKAESEYRADAGGI